MFPLELSREASCGALSQRRVGGVPPFFLRAGWTWFRIGCLCCTSPTGTTPSHSARSRPTSARHRRLALTSPPVLVSGEQRGISSSSKWCVPCLLSQPAPRHERDIAPALRSSSTFNFNNTTRHSLAALWHPGWTCVRTQLFFAARDGSGSGWMRARGVGAAARQNSGSPRAIRGLARTEGALLWAWARRTARRGTARSLATPGGDGHGRASACLRRRHLAREWRPRIDGTRAAGQRPGSLWNGLA